MGILSQLRTHCVRNWKCLVKFALAGNSGESVPLFHGKKSGQAGGRSLHTSDTIFNIARTWKTRSLKTVFINKHQLQTGAGREWSSSSWIWDCGCHGIALHWNKPKIIKGTERMILIAIFFPGLSFLLRGKLLKAIFCIGLQITLIGWIPAAIWAMSDLSNSRANRRTDRLVNAIEGRRR